MSPSRCSRQCNVQPLAHYGILKMRIHIITESDRKHVIVKTNIAADADMCVGNAG